MAKKKKRDKNKKKKATAPVPSSIGASQPRLELLAETKLEQLLEHTGQSRFEASGLHHKDGHLYIVLDNAPQIVRVKTETDTASIVGELIELGGDGEGYEAITFQPRERRWYCLVESAKTRKGGLKPRVDVFDVALAHLESFWLDFTIESDNKGFEGLSSIRYRGEELLLGLCEGNDCKGGKVGRTPGKGRIQLFRRAPNTWAHVDTVKLPSSVQFEDYADLDIHGRHVTVLSQATSAVWVGRVRENAKDLDNLWEDDGYVYHFPRDADGEMRYCNLEGIAWIDDETIALVSDKAKAGKQPKACVAQDQSIHIFKVVV